MGAGYLIYLGIRALLERGATRAIEVSSTRSLWRIWSQGVLVSIFNPKIAVFFLAFLPQFVEPGTIAPQRQVLFLGLLYVGLALLTDSAYALIAGNARNWLRDRRIHASLPRYMSGTVYLGLGVSTAFVNQRQ